MTAKEARAVSKANEVTEADHKKWQLDYVNGKIETVAKRGFYSEYVLTPFPLYNETLNDLMSRGFDVEIYAEPQLLGGINYHRSKISWR